MPKRERSASAALFAFGLSVCLALGPWACSSGSEDAGSSEPIREQTDRTESSADQERTREMEDRNGGGY